MRTLHRVLANTSALLAAGAVALEANKMGTRKAAENVKTGGAKDSVRDVIGASKLNYPSPMYNEVKKGIFNFKTPNTPMNVAHGVSGYVKGFVNGVSHHLATVGFAALTLIAKGAPDKKVSSAFKTIGVIGMGASVVWNFIKNGTNVFEKKNYLDK